MSESSSNRGTWDRRRPELALLAIAALIPAVPIVIGASVTSAGGGAGTAQASLRPVVQSPPAVSQPTNPPGPGAIVAHVLRRTSMRASPGGRRIADLGLHTEFGSPESLWVVDLRPDWLGVVSPLAGNGRLGWIPRSVVSLSRVTWELKVSLSAHQLTVIDGGQVVHRYTVAIGAPSAPTPTGRFAVTDRLATGDPSGPYGCCIMALSAHSPHAIQGWVGGNRIAIHSTPDASSIGLPVSHGCLRLTLAEGRWLMTHVPLGTPTLISA